MMDAVIESANRPPNDQKTAQRGPWVVASVALAVAAITLGFGIRFWSHAEPPAVAPAPVSVTVSEPLSHQLESRLQFLGQFSPVERVELRAQVGGTLTKIGFKDGDVVRKGDVLFEIDPTQYQVKLREATAQLEGAQARYDLSLQELQRAQTLKETEAGTVENVEQRQGELRTAQAAIHAAQAAIQDAKFDLDHCVIPAPFTGRMGNHQVSIGNLISGSRAGATPTTLLATIVSLNPIYLDFDMSEADYLAFERERRGQKSTLTNTVQASLADEPNFGHAGTLNFIDNSLDRSSGTIHARATLPNPDLMLTPGVFARVRLPSATTTSTLLVPDEAVLPDQSEHMVLTVGTDSIVKPKVVQLGDMRGGLRVIHSGLSAHDSVIIGGIPSAAPGTKVTTHSGTITFGSDQDRSTVQP